MSELAIRRFQPDDGERVCELNEAAARATDDFAPEVSDADLDDVPGHYLDDQGEFLVGFADGEIVATGAYAPADEWVLADRFEFDRPTAQVTRMRVGPAHHRHGYGSELYHELEFRARSDGYHQLVLDTGVDNDAARRFYRSLGFEFVRGAVIAGFGKSFELAVYRKSLVG